MKTVLKVLYRSAHVRDEEGEWKKMVKRIHNWEVIDPLIFEEKQSMVSIANKFNISYRSVTNRKYQVRDRFEKKMKRKLRFDEIYKMIKKGRKK